MEGEDKPLKECVLLVDAEEIILLVNVDVEEDGFLDVEEDDEVVGPHYYI